MVIYIAKNIFNNKMYIGKTTKNIEDRKRQHFYDAFSNNSQTHFHRALRKYGKDAFIWEILSQYNNEKELNEAEIFFIDNFKSIKEGYNMTSGGDGGACIGESNPFYGKTHTIEVRKRISENSKQHIENHFKSGEDNPMFGKIGELNPFYGKTHTPETLLRLSEAGKQHIENHFKSSEDNPMYGKHLTDEHKQSLSDASSKNWKIIMPGGEEITYKSLRKFCLLNGLNYSYAKQCARIHKQYKGFYFQNCNTYVTF